MVILSFCIACPVNGTITHISAYRFKCTIEVKITESITGGWHLYLQFSSQVRSIYVRLIRAIIPLEPLILTLSKHIHLQPVTQYIQALF